MAFDKARHVRGVLVIDLVKFLKELQKTKPLPPLSPAAQALLAPRLLPTEWYPLSSFLDLLQASNATMIKGQEARAIELGAAGGAARLKGAYKVYLNPGEPTSSIISLRHLWPSQYDFGRLTAEIQPDSAVEFTLDDYEDLGMVHGMTIVGWGIAAARLCGVGHASAQVLERPWQGSARFRYRIVL